MGLAVCEREPGYFCSRLYPRVSVNPGVGASARRLWCHNWSKGRGELAQSEPHGITPGVRDTASRETPWGTAGHPSFLRSLSAMLLRYVCSHFERVAHHTLSLLHAQQSCWFLPLHSCWGAMSHAVWCRGAWVGEKLL